MRPPLRLPAAALGVAAALPSVAWAQQAAYHDGRMWGGWHGWFLGPVTMILLLAVLVAGIVLLVRWLGGGPHQPGPHQPERGRQSPLDILKERFARGEIDAREFEERRRVLGE